LKCFACVFGQLVVLGDAGGGDGGRVVGGGQLSTRCLGGVKEMSLFALERRPPLRDFVSLALRALALEVCAVKLFAKLSQHSLAFLDICARCAEVRTDLLLALRMDFQRLLGRPETRLELGQLHGGSFQLTTHASGDGVALATLLLGPLATRHGIAQPLFGDRDLTAQLLRVLAGLRRASRARFAGLRLSYAPRRHITRRFGGAEFLFAGRDFPQ
jgi:hypothetical protein